MARRLGGRGNSGDGGRQDGGESPPVTRTHNLAARQQMMDGAFARMWALEREAREIRAEKIAGLLAEKSSIWRRLRADLGQRSEDLRPAWLMYRRACEIAAMDDMVEREASRDAMREAYLALPKGSTLDFLAVLAALPDAQPDALPLSQPSRGDGYTAALGREAYAEGRRLSDNPGRPGSGEAVAWETGWREAEGEAIMAMGMEDPQP